MKLFFTLIFAAVILAGCSKQGDVNPQTNKNNSTGTTPPDASSGLSHDDSIHMPKFNINRQTVKTSVSGSKLTLVFNENVDILFTSEAYQKISAVHLQEDFKTTLLNGLDFTTVAQGGNTTLDWVDDNLNNVILKKVSDTLINNVKMMKINVNRPFTFFKSYASNKDALNAQTFFISKTDDTVVFTSFSYYNQKNYLPQSEAAVLVYTK
ncbi:hypothetical protein [Mucilaginibacter gotjawali]|uniref:Uncharacterized protein n=1 Tax=Mucilaginibacter gotjawali TaxID=1550579 RepID=A0A839SGX2_9SPHI|nr:hypothetical protein [Mucilaginibacter gotjawali]MBB3057076.1 hypothetical protein [Mucilaginibacter gotjawali]